MKMRILLSVFLFLFAFQQIHAQNERFIEVTGSAEIEVQPDEIELEVVVKEFYSKDFFKKDIKEYKLGTVSEDKQSLDRIEDSFFEVLKDNNIDKNTVVLEGNYYYWYYWWSYRNQTLKRKRYKLKLRKETDFLKLVQSLNEPWVESIRITNSKNERLQEYRQEVKIAAIKAAKEKASYLLESIDEKVGRVISIIEINNDYRNSYRRGNNMVSNVALTSSVSDDDIAKVASIRLRYEIKAKFEIQ